ncbi:hypothetical protein [Rummeliibacillus sp. POC4]|uniref:hypothetical protein n=1 Tax=Rummeliibacillus sp. POC4 TaxID=2305899 RepID=UPI000E66ED83|nr:hypothetical protein [Rummeliibacillus sp. POC4]RIJ67068.1 hypothetical protein D1606_04775 [Rummeliibacillus sp. POC4]
MKFHRLQIISCLLLSMILIACGKDDAMETSEKVKFTIELKDSTNNEQSYLIRILSDGKQTDKVAITPQDMSLISGDQKKVTANLYINVPYTIKIYKTDKKSMDEYFSKPKSGSTDTTEQQEEHPIATKTITPTRNTNTITISIPE